jgi:hypothetical protein
VDFCLANRVQPTVCAFIQESLLQIGSVNDHMIVDAFAAVSSTEAKKSGPELVESRISLLVSFSYAILKKPDLQVNHAKDWRNGALIAHAIIDDLVREGMKPVQATILLIMCKCI